GSVARVGRAVPARGRDKALLAPPSTVPGARARRRRGRPAGLHDEAAVGRDVLEGARVEGPAVAPAAPPHVRRCLPRGLVRARARDHGRTTVSIATVARRSRQSICRVLLSPFIRVLPLAGVLGAKLVVCSHEPIDFVTAFQTGTDEVAVIVCQRE